MPTFNQLVRKGRQDKKFKSKAPALQKRAQLAEEEGDGPERTAEARRLHIGSYHDAEEAELCTA